MEAKAYLPLFKDAYKDWSEDKASRLAAALAYYTALSLAPMIVLGVLLLKFLEMDGQRIIEDQMAMMMGESGKTMAGEMIKNAKASSGWVAGTISFLVLIWGASNVFAELQDSMNTIWEVQPKPDLGIWGTIKKRFFSMAMVLGIGFLLLTSLFVSTILTGMAHKIAGEGRVIAFLLDFVLTLLVTTAFFSAIFKLLPDVKITWKDVLPGAILTGVLFTLGKYLLTWYLTKGSTASAYGAAGSLAAVLIWVYYSAQIMFFGAEFTQAYAHKFGSDIQPDEDAIPVTEEKRAQQGLVREHDKQAATKGVAAMAGKRGVAYPREAVPPRRVVTITRPTPEAQKAYALAGLGIAAGFVVGAVGMLSGRKYTSGGIKQIALDDRLRDLESRLQGRPPELVGTAIRVEERLDDLDARLRGAQAAVNRRRQQVAREKQRAARVADGRPPTFKEKFEAAYRARRGEPNIIERLTGVSTKPTFFERLGEMIGKS
jgi:membrane protein